MAKRPRRRVQNQKARGHKVDRYKEHETLFKSARDPYQRRGRYGMIESESE